MSLTIRRVTDAAAAESALSRTAGCSRAVIELPAVLARSNIHLMVAYDGAEPVGSVIAYELPRLLRAGTGMLLYSIDVATNHRRKGVGKALIAALQDVARDRGCDATWLLTNASNGAAMALYSAAGGRRPNADDAMWEFPLGDAPDAPPPTD